jgi:hypothetical protein
VVKTQRILLQIDVVKDNRLYPSWSTDAGKSGPGVTTKATGIVSAKKAINRLHGELARGGFEQVIRQLSCFVCC